MSLDIITFEKSFQERLTEYTDILGGRAHLPVCGIQNEWYYYIENLLEPIGWQAVWKISRQKCDEFKIRFPTLVIVMVKDVIFQELQAVVDIVAVQDDISLAEQHEVPLTSLYPTKKQENKMLDIYGTANCLDQLRFFYVHLWRPWDCDDENQDWLLMHLEARLQLYYDMQSGALMHETGQHIRVLLEEAREIEHKMRIAKEEEAETDEIDENKALEIMQLQIRREEIKREMEILENPLMRNLVVKKRYEVVQAKRQKRGHLQEACFVWLGGTVDEFINVLTKVRSVIQPETYIKTCPFLQDALDRAIAGDMVILCPGTHDVCSTGGLEEGGSIMGFLEPSATAIVAHDAGNVLLDWSADVTLENLTVDAHSMQMAMSIRNGTVRLRNCQIVGGNACSTGILVLKGGYLEAQSCEFVNFGIGLVLDHAAQVSLEDCNITSCNIGIKMCEDASVLLQKCNVSGCSEYGIKIEILQPSDKEMGSQQVGSVVMLERFKNFKLDGTTVEGNKKGDVLKVYQEDNILYESGDSECILPEAV